MSNFLKAIMAFITKNEVFLDIFIFAMRRIFGNEVVDEVIALVKQVSIETIRGREKFYKVRDLLDSKLITVKPDMQNRSFWLDLLIQAVATYLKVTKKIQ